MDPYDPALAPPAFGLNNTGVICYLNSFLQALAGCTALVRAVLQNAAYVAQTRTGVAMLAYFRAFAAADGAGRVAARGETAPDAPQLSARVLAALAEDLRERRPWVRFGGGQESASEALVHILDMMEPPRLSAEDEAALIPDAAAADAPPGRPLEIHVTSAESPITRLFLHRFRCELHCRKCRQVVSKETDYAVIFNLFHLDALRAQPATAADFSRAVRLQVSEVDSYKCPACKEEARAIRVYNLTMVPEIIVCAFNLYVGYGGVRRTRYFPDRLEFPAVDGGKLVFRLVGQVEHAGALSGGHYWARGLRAGGQVHLLNDTGVSLAAFAPTPNTYLLTYHYEGQEPAPA